MNKHMKYVVLTSLMAPMATTAMSATLEQEDVWDKDKIDEIKASVSKQLQGHDNEIKLINYDLDLFKQAIELKNGDEDNKPMMKDTPVANIFYFLTGEKTYLFDTYGETGEKLYNKLNELTSNNVTDEAVADLIRILGQYLATPTDVTAAPEATYNRHALTSGIQTNITGSEQTLAYQEQDNVTAEIIAKTTEIGKRLAQTIDETLQSYYPLNELLNLDNAADKAIEEKLKEFAKHELYSDRLKAKLYIRMKTSSENDDKIAELKKKAFKITYHNSLADEEDITSLKEYNDNYQINAQLDFTKFSQQIKTQLLKYKNTALEGLASKIKTDIQTITEQFKASIDNASKIQKDDLITLANNLHFKGDLQKIYKKDSLTGVKIDDTITAKALISECAKALKCSIPEDQMWGFTLSEEQANYITTQIEAQPIETFKQALTEIANDYTTITFSTDITSLENEDLIAAIIEEYTQQKKITLWQIVSELTTNMNETKHELTSQIEELKKQNNELRSQLETETKRVQLTQLDMKEAFITFFNTMIPDADKSKRFIDMITNENDSSKIKATITQNFKNQIAARSAFSIVSLDTPILTTSPLTYRDVDEAIRSKKLNISSLTHTSRPKSRDAKKCQTDMNALKEALKKKKDIITNIKIKNVTEEVPEESKEKDKENNKPVNLTLSGGKGSSSDDGKKSGKSGEHKLDPNTPPTEILCPTNNNLTLDPKAYDNINYLLQTVTKKYSNATQLKSSLDYKTYPHSDRKLTDNELQAAYETTAYMRKYHKTYNDNDTQNTLWSLLQKHNALTTKTESK